MGENEVEDLLIRGDLRRVPSDHETAVRELLVARTHVSSAQMLMGADPTLAFVAL